MSIVQFGLLFHARNIAENAAQTGASAARRYDGTELQARQQTETYLADIAGTTLLNDTVTVTRTPDQATVNVRGVVASLIPGLHLTVQESASGPVERFVPPPQGPQS